MKDKYLNYVISQVPKKFKDVTFSVGSIRELWLSWKTFNCANVSGGQLFTEYSYQSLPNSIRSEVSYFKSPVLDLRIEVY